MSDNGTAHTLLVAGAAAAIVTLVPVALYQTGALRSLSDPPAAIFQSERIVSSKDAHPLGVPDGLLGIASFGATLTLALLAPRSRVARHLLGWKLSGDGAVASVNVVKQLVRFRAICSWCTATALAAGVATTAGRRYLER